MTKTKQNFTRSFIVKLIPFSEEVIRVRFNGM